MQNSNGKRINIIPVGEVSSPAGLIIEGRETFR